MNREEARHESEIWNFFSNRFSVVTTIWVRNKLEQSFNFQYIRYLEEGQGNKYSSIQDYYYYPETGILVIKVDGSVDISIQNKTESIKTHVILFNKDVKRH